MRVAQKELRHVQRSAHKLAEAKDDLRQAVKLARASGETQADIARAAGLSPSRIAQLERGE